VRAGVYWITRLRNTGGRSEEERAQGEGGVNYVHSRRTAYGIY